MTDASNIVEFLTARMDDEERRFEIPEWHGTDASRAEFGPAWGSRGNCPLCDQHIPGGHEGGTADMFSVHMERPHRRSFVLADIAAKRAILALHPLGDDECGGQRYAPSGGDPIGCLTQFWLARPFA